LKAPPWVWERTPAANDCRTLLSLKRLSRH